MSRKYLVATEFWIDGKPQAEQTVTTSKRAFERKHGGNVTYEWHTFDWGDILDFIPNDLDRQAVKIALEKTYKESEVTA